jgi:cation-transporting ATPase I
MGLLGWVAGLRDSFASERKRSLSVVGQRAYVEFRGIAPGVLPHFASLLEEEAVIFPNLAELGLEPLTRRVMLRFVGDVPHGASLCGVVARAEARAGAAGQPWAHHPEELRRTLPDDEQLDLQYSIEALVDAAALLVGMGLRVVPFFPRRLGTNFYGLVFLTQHVQALRKPLEDRYGKERTELALNLLFSVAQAAAQRPLSSFVDLTAKVASLRELRARRELWERWAPVLTQHDHATTADLPEPRPVDLPRGPIERHHERAWMVALGTFGVSLITSRSPSRAFAAGFAALPQPARLGRELYAAELGRMLARHGMLVLSPRALRRLDRVNCLVMPAELVSSEQFTVGDVFALRGLSRAQALLIARRMFSSDRPLRVRHESGYTLGPVGLLECDVDADIEVSMAERARRGELVLGLSRDNRLVGLVDVHISPESGVLEAVSLARQAGMHIVLASDDVGATEGREPHDVIGLTRGLSAGIRRLQSEGKVVCFIGRGPSEGYAAADFGVALHVRDQATPWGAHLICPDDARLVETVVTACTNARMVSEQSVRMAIGAAALGTLVSTGGVAARRVMFVLNAASLVAMTNAARRSAAVEGSSKRHVDPTPWQALDTRGVLTRLGTTEHGLPERPRIPPAKAALDFPALRDLGQAIRTELYNPLSPVLALGAGVSAMVGSMADAGIVAGVGGINALIGGVQRWKTERALNSLIRAADTRVKVRRSGKVSELLASELLRGDIVLFTQGDQVPADCRILESTSLEVDTSSLTGESLPVAKGPAPSFSEHTADVTSMLFAGTSIAAGRATAVVVATGEDTVARRAAAALPDEQRGGVEARLRELMKLTGPVAVAAGAALVTAGMLRGRRVDDLVSTGVGLAVAAVPEGLPLLATAAQLSAAERLSKKGALVKNARAIEALGRIDVLCLDKTGTLTEGRIELASVFDGAELASVGPHGEGASALPRLGAAHHGVLEAGRLSVARTGAVDPLVVALLGAARAELGALSLDTEVVAERAFESGRGYEAVLVRRGDAGHLYVKGAPEVLFTRASHGLVGGEHQPLDELRARFSEVLSGLAAHGLRVIAIGERAVSAAELADPESCLASPTGLTLRGLVAFRDPVRPSARAGISGLAAAGVRTVMITGDHPATAETIAREVGIAAPGQVLHGTQIAQLTEPDLEYAVRRVSVFARVSPAQKVRIVRALQRAGHVVGMVGDGANDAPAMRIADAGIAVGTGSTEAARAAGDLVLMDSRIDALVEAVVEGRAMWTAVRDAVSILVGGNLGEIAFTVAVGGLTGRPPLSPRQLLLVNFLTDIAPSMAIALRPPAPENLEALRKAGPEASLGAPLDREIVARAISTSLGAGTAWTLGRLTGSAGRARTIGLVGLVGTQLGQTLRSGGNSRPVFWTSIGSAAALAFIVQTPGLSQLFGCRPLGPFAWMTALGASTGATMLSPLVDTAVDRVADLIQAARAPITGPSTRVEVRVEEPSVAQLGTPALRLLRN